jgi:hypothetical protein
MRRLAIAVLVLVIAAAAAASASASIPSSDTSVFHACMDKFGRIRMIDREAGATCKTSESAIQWQQDGPMGPQGPQGPAGSGIQMARDLVQRGVPTGAPLQSITLADLPELAAIIGSDANLATVTSRNVILQVSARATEFGSPRLLLAWIGDPAMVAGVLTWPIRLEYPSTGAEYSRQSPSSAELMELVVISSAAD